MGAGSISRGGRPLAQPAVGGRAGKGQVSTERLFSLCQPYGECRQADKIRTEAHGELTSKERKVTLAVVLLLILYLASQCCCSWLSEQVGTCALAAGCQQLGAPVKVASGKVLLALTGAGTGLGETRTKALFPALCIM